MIDFRIKSFLMVCKYMNFTRASEELNITQPAVSQHIRYLEEYYQARLFDYKNRKIALTEAGECLLNAATTMQHDEIHLRSKIKELQGKKSSLTFGVTLTVGEFVMPRPLARLLSLYPQTSVKMTVANTQELLQKLNNGELDFVLVEGFFAKKEYDSLVYSTENYIPVCGNCQHFGKPMERIEDTFSERLIMREAGSGTREIFERYLESRNFQIQDYANIVEINNISTIKTLVADGCGITFLYEAAVKNELESGLLIKIPLQDFSVKHDFTFLWRRNSVFSDYYRSLFEIIRGSSTI